LCERRLKRLGSSLLITKLSHLRDILVLGRTMACVQPSYREEEDDAALELAVDQLLFDVLKSFAGTSKTSSPRLRSRSPVKIDGDKNYHHNSSMVGVFSRRTLQAQGLLNISKDSSRARRDQR
jgi:hypothetical protein